MRYKKRTAVLGMLFLFAILAGGGNGGKGTVAGTNYYYPEKEAETQKETETGSTEQIKAELAAEHYMIVVNDMTTETLVLEQMLSGKQYLFSYSLTTNFLDKYGNNTSVSYFEPGRIITVGEKDTQGKLKTAQITDVVWEYENVVRFDIDEERGVFKIADTKYTFEADLFVVSEGEPIKLADIRKDDELRIVGMNKEILSVTITTGHGRIALENTELFEDSFIQIGSKIFAEITGEIELEVPEGIYTVTVANKGYGGSKEYEVKRNKTTVIDLDELKGKGPKMGAITFEIGTTDENDDAEITFKIDGKVVEYEKPIELAYGIHSIAAEAFGYETYAKKLFVNSEKATIAIALDTETSKSTTNNAEKETSSEKDTNLAGSLAGSTANRQEENTSDNNELVEALKEALSGNSSTDYLSTLTQLLGSGIY